MATSGSANFGLNRDQVITMALRRVNAIGQGETPDTNAVTEAALVLNAMVKEWQSDGMPLWKISTFSFTPVAGTASYQVKVGGTVNRYPPMKILQAWYRNTSTNADTPINLNTRYEYNLLTPKTSQASNVAQLYYDPPGNQGQASQEPAGTVYLWNVPNASFVAANSIFIVGEFMYEDFDASTDYPDFPSNFNNALAWGLADELAFDYGVPPGQASRIAKKALASKQKAMEIMPEEGSMFIQPMWHGR